MTTQHAEGVSRGRAALNGVLATGAGLGAGHLVALLAPASSPIVAVATRAIDLTPGPVKDWAVSTFGTADKAVLVAGAIVVTLGLGALVGLVARWSTRAGLVCSAALAVRVDRGPWADATLGPDAGIEYWRQWIWTWDSTSGEHELQVRVVDTAGKPQDEALANAFPNGASGLHTIKVTAR